jgi:hypothetical protein
VKALLEQHTGLLMSQPELVKSLMPLYQLVEARVQTYHKLLKLEGRLDLALSQMAGHARGGGGGEGGYNHEPELVVQEMSHTDMVIGAADDYDDEEEDEEDEEGEDEEGDEDEDEGDEDMDEDMEDD